MTTPTDDAVPKTQSSGKKKKKIVNPTIEAFKSMKDAVHNALTNCEPGDELETLIRTLQHDAQVQQVRDDILAAFQSYYPGEFEEGQIHLFGSPVMGLAFKDSDFDIYIELPSREQQKSKSAKNKKIRNLLEPTKKFANFESITRPRIPLIRCTHIGTLTNCDFNSSNKLGTLNSPIIAHILKFDPRIHKLAIIIKYWAKIHDCAGANRISNYAIVWMLIFYLQTLPEPIVPPIEEFQRNVPPSMVSHYNYAFDYSMPNKTENQSQWPELLLGFFKFYRDFDYASQLICPLYGKTFSKTDVQQKKLIEFRRYEEILLTEMENPMHLSGNFLCIQDPFEIVRKVPSDLPIKIFQKIVFKIGCAAEIVKSALKKGETESLLLQIFDVAKFDEYANKNADVTKKLMKSRKESLPKFIQRLPISRTSKTNDRDGKISLQLKPTDCVLDVIQNGGLKSLTDDSTAQIDVRKMWAKEVIEMIPDILRDVFLLKLHDEPSNDEPLSDEPSTDEPSKDEPSIDKSLSDKPLGDESSNDKLSNEFVKEFNLKGARNLFVGRKLKSSRTWNDEVLDSSNRFSNQTSDNIPLNVSAKITADMVNFDYVSFELNDEIGTTRDNYYKTFCRHVIERLDYFLRSYFNHRNKSNIANVNEAKLKPITRPVIQLTPIVKQNRTATFTVIPNEFTLSMVKNMLKIEDHSNGDATIGKHFIQQLWAQEVIKMIPDVLRDIFKLELHAVTSNTHLHTFNITGLYCKAYQIFAGRKHSKLLTVDRWMSEVLDSQIRYDLHLFHLDFPVKMHAKIAVDVKNFSYVSIEVTDRLRTKKRNYYRIFCQEFFRRIDYYLKIYFVHRNHCNEMAKSGILNAYPAATKQDPETPKQPNPTSTLPNTHTVSHDAQPPKDAFELKPTEIRSS